MCFDDVYANVKDLFGATPDPILVRFRDAIPVGPPALDLGAGQGRHTFYLARRGMTVHALDPSRVALDEIARIARDEDLPVTTHLASFEYFAAPVPVYSAVLAFGLMPLLDWASIESLAQRLTEWTREGSLVFATGFTTGDSRFQQVASSCRKIGKNSFAQPNGELRTYMEPGEVTRLFEGFEVVHHWEGLGPVHQHGSLPPERHAMFELVLKR